MLEAGTLIAERTKTHSEHRRLSVKHIVLQEVDRFEEGVVAQTAERVALHTTCGPGSRLEQTRKRALCHTEYLPLYICMTKLSFWLLAHNFFIFSRISLCPDPGHYDATSWQA
jgi:hypothetical protein